MNIKDTDLAKANRYSINCIWITTLIMSFSWLLNMLNIFIVDQGIMNIAMIGMWLLLALAHILKAIFGVESKLASYITLFMLVSVITFANVMVAYHTSLFMLFPMVCSVLYSKREYTIYTFVLTAIGLAVSILVGFRIGLCDANMLLLTTSTTEYHATEIMSGNVELNHSILNLILFFFFPRFITLIGFTSLLNYIKKNIQEKTEREFEIRRIAETDGLTGLYNRNKYNQMTKQKLSFTVAAIYIDINDLKVINDSIGHEQGDVLICGMANILKKYQSDKCKSYRLGGDEFCTIIENPRKDETAKFVEQLRKDVSESKLMYGLKLSAAIGYAEGDGMDIKAVVKEADDKMYSNKLSMKRA